MADILEEKIHVSASQARDPLSFKAVVKTTASSKHGYDMAETHSFRVNTFPAFSEGDFSLGEVIDRLSKCAHIHDKTIFSGSLPYSSANCNCNCNCDCGDDGGGN